MSSIHSVGGVCDQLSHHIPHQLRFGFGSVDPGLAVRVSARLQQLHLYGHQAASD